MVFSCIKNKLRIFNIYIFKTHINTKQELKRKFFFFELILKVMQHILKYLIGVVRATC